MIAFMDECSVETRIGRSSCRETLRTHLKTIAFSKGPFSHLQLSSQQIFHFLTERHTFVSNCSAYLPGTVRRFGKKYEE